jgi:hypothetical protein
MPTLHQLLQRRTLLLTAQPRAPYTPRPQMEATQGHSQTGDVGHQNWGYAMHHSASDPPYADNVRIGVEHRGHLVDALRTQLVCERIEWRNPRVFLPGSNDAIELPLTDRFLLGYHDGVGGGTLPSTEPSPYFVLSMTMQQGTQYVYCYELDGNSLTPLGDNDVAADDRSINVPDGGQIVVTARPGLPNMVVSYDHIYIIVVVSLVMGEARNDFEPTGNAWMSRIYPTTTVFANTSLAKVEATVRIVRPSYSPMAGMRWMGNQIGAILCADRNDFTLTDAVGLPNFPTWDKLFDYFLSTDVPPEGSSPGNRNEVFAAVHHTHDGQGRPDPRAGAGAQGRTLSGREVSVTSARPGEVYVDYAPTPVPKLPGQGEFDNLHLAPTMMGTWNGRPIPVVMAPLCAHDCFHMHWRWGQGLGGAGLSGFSVPLPFAPLGLPNSTPGAPLCPRNQDVVIALVDGRGVEYRARCFGPIDPFIPQIVLHHGAAYALFIEETPDLQTRLLGDVTARVGGSFPGFYHVLRFESYSDRPGQPHFVERIRAPGGLDGLREVSLRPHDL